MSDEFTTGGCNPSDCASCGGGCASSGGCDPIENHKTITLTMEDDTEVECAVLTVFPVDAKEYIALLPLDENGQNESVKSISTPLPAPKTAIRCSPTLKAMKNTQKQPLHLTLFYRTPKTL